MMHGVVVDFYTLYDPVALAGSILAYVPFYGTLYVSKHSLWLEATSCSGHGWVPISGFKLLEDDIDFWGVKWLRNWVRINLNVAEDALAKENLYSAIMLIQESLEIGILKVLPNDAEIIGNGKEILASRLLPPGTLHDSMMTFGNGRENSFYLSPDLGHGLQLGVGLIFERKNGFRFSTSNPEIERSLRQLLSPEYLLKRVENERDEKVTWRVKCGPKITVNDVSELLRQNKASEVISFLERIEQLEKNLMYFAPKVWLDYSQSDIALCMELTCRTVRVADDMKARRI